MGANSIYFIISCIVLTFSGCTYDKSNYKKLTQPIIINKPRVEKEIIYINKLKDQVDDLKRKNGGKFVQDAYNLLVNEKNRYDKPVKGGFIRVHFRSEPKVLLSYLDNSAVTGYINAYMFDSLLYQDKETFKWRPSLAKSYKVEDIVWLKGHREDSVFKEKGDNNYLIGHIDESKIQWDSGKKKILKLFIRVGHKEKEIRGDQLRYKHDKENPDDPKDDYIRAYDKGVMITYHLRKDVKWHDGKPFTADDVLFTMNVIKNRYILELANQRNYFQSLKAWKKEGKHTIKIYFDKQYFLAFDIASGFDILPKHIYIPEGKSFTEKEFASYFVKHETIIVKDGFGPVGTGPYYFPSKSLPSKNQETGWVKSDHILLVRNDNYFNKNRSGYLKKIIFRIMPDGDIAFLELKNGKIDFLYSLTTTQYFDSSTTKSFKSKLVKALYYLGAFGWIGYNMKKVYFKDSKVRTAITLLLDRKRVLKNIYYKVGKIVSGSQNYFGPAYNHSVKPYSYNRERAIKLLNEAGWIDTDGDGVRDQNGIPFKTELIYSGSIAPPFAILLKEELTSIGINLKLTRLEWTIFLDHLSDHKFDLCTLGWVTSPESDPYQIWHSSQWANRGSNMVGFQSEEADKLILLARRTLNDKKRRKLYFDFHKILHREQPYLFLFTAPNKAVYHNRYRNVKFYILRPGWDLREWTIPKSLQTQEEIKAEMH